MASRTLNRLSPMFVAKTKEPGRHADGGGLYLKIDEEGRRRWVFMFTRDGKRTELGLGSGRDLPLADARAIAAEFRAALERGEDPRVVRAKGRAGETFGPFADQYIADMEPGWKNAKHVEQWKMTLKDYAAKLRPMRLEAISTNDVLSVLKPLWTRTPETAERLRGRIEAVLDAAKAQGLRQGDNPARWRGHLNTLLPPRSRLKRGHHTAMPYDDLPGFMANLRERPAQAARLLEFTILTAARTGESLLAKWAEFDLEKALWTIPKDRMKAGREHRVPLSARALEILEEIRAEQAAEWKVAPKLVFPASKADKPLSNMAMSALLKRMDVKVGDKGVTVHGFRSTFRDWASETTGFPHEVCEMALAHSIGNKAEAAYRRGDLFEKRRKLMEAWAGFCGSASVVHGNVSRLPARIISG